MPKAAKIKLKWHNDEMEWRNESGEAVPHPRYENSPSSLTGKSFIKGYLAYVKDGSKSLNDYMKTHGNFSKKEVQDAAKVFRGLFEEVSPGNTFALLREKKNKTEADKKKAQADIKELVAELGIAKPKQSRPRKK